MYAINSKDRVIVFGNLKSNEFNWEFVPSKGDYLMSGKLGSEDLSKSEYLTAKSDYFVMGNRSKSDLIQF